MSNLKNEILRINTMINNDRVSLSDSFNELFNYDLNNVIKEYFDVLEPIKIAIEKQGNQLIVQVGFTANAIKSFRNLNL